MNKLLHHLIAVFLCFTITSCTISEPDQNVLNISVINNSDVVLQSLWAYTIYFDDMEVNATNTLQTSESLSGFYRSGTHQIDFRADNKSFRCYGPQIFDGNYEVVIERNNENGLFNVFINGEGRNTTAEIRFSELDAE